MRRLFFTLLLVFAAFLGFAQVNPQAPLELDKNVKSG